MVGELSSAGGQVFNAGRAGVVGHGAGFERAEVAVERGVGLAELPVDAGELPFDVGRRRAAARRDGLKLMIHPTDPVR